MMKNTKDETNVHRTLIVDAPVEFVWAALSDPKLTHLSLAWSLKGELQRGKRFQWMTRDEEGSGGAVAAEGTVLTLFPGERLRYSHYDVRSGLPDEPASRTTVDLHLIAETPGRTRLELWQGDFLGLPHAARRAREAGRQWVERLVGVKRVAEELSRAQAA
ncbi:MAG: SRPBCC domain-containing protein [Flavobacteriales bacterium]|nr:SRPBCC domain-containing protein [Flavobacteriales bacterium]